MTIEEWAKDFKSYVNGLDMQRDDYNGVMEYVDDAISVLKEQKAKSPVIREKNGYWDYVCPTCGSRDEELFREWNYCPFCGQKVKWNETD